MDPRGRSCPLAYRYQPEALAQPAQLEADTLYLVGGLYGNPYALAAALEPPAVPSAQPWRPSTGMQGLRPGAQTVVAGVQPLNCIEYS